MYICIYICTNIFVERVLPFKIDNGYIQILN
jgi:hypothetical protein